MNFIIHVSSVITDGDKILLVKEGKQILYNLYNLPGGHLEKNESFIEGALREVKEETGLTVEIDYLIDIVVTRSDNYYINFVFHANYLSCEPVPLEGEIQECKWFTVNEILNMPDEKLVRPNRFKQIINDYINGKRTDLNTFVNFVKAK
ncbi:MAG TPA: NUDIX domain-containing protein [Ignavibacteria bacterium]|nr:NUDIX domain-containing protein [Ignavibacteria bacterium]